MGHATDVQVGPWGGNGSSSYEFKPNGRITKIHVALEYCGACIESIAFEYVSKCDNKVHRTETYGGDYTANQKSMTIESGEEIVEISGKFGSYEGDQTVVTFLVFKTNKKTCEFGDKFEGKRFSLPVNTNNTKFVGFHGKYGNKLNSIGAFLDRK